MLLLLPVSEKEKSEIKLVVDCERERFSQAIPTKLTQTRLRDQSINLSLSLSVSLSLFDTVTNWTVILNASIEQIKLQPLLVYKSTFSDLIEEIIIIF